MDESNASNQDPSLATPPVDEALELKLDSLATADALHEKPPASNTGIWLLISLGAFLLSQAGGFNLKSIVLLVVVLLIHELGHYVGMLVFGYRDVRMFFIPFFGAAVTGKKHAAPAWQQLIVLLLGPLPGILLATAMYALLRPKPETIAFDAVLMLLGLNAFNLLPLLPLDGGRVMHLLIFRRHPVLEVLFRVLAAAALGGLAFLSGSIILGAIALVSLFGTGFHYKLAAQAQRLRRVLPSIAGDWKLASDEERHAVYEASAAMVPQDRLPQNIAKRMLLLHDAAATRSPGLLSTFGFLVLYGAGMVVVVGLVFAIAMDQRVANEQIMLQDGERIKQLHEKQQPLFDKARRLEAEGKAEEAAAVRAEANRAFGKDMDALFDDAPGKIQFVPAE